MTYNVFSRTLNPTQSIILIAASRGKNHFFTRPSCWIQISTVDVINIAADRQKFMILAGELSWQRLRRSAVPGLWLCPPKFKWFTWLNHAPFRDALPSTG